MSDRSRTGPSGSTGLADGAEVAAAALTARLSGRPELQEAPVRDLAIAAHAAVAGGAAACRFYEGPLRVADKGGNDPVTEADHASNHAILDILGKLRPDDPVLSEESPPPAEGRRDGRLWVVDPLDGTKEFIAGNGEFSIMVGLAVEGRCVLGAVYEPTAGRLSAGLASGGAWTVSRESDTWSVAPLALPPFPTVERPIRFVRSRSHPDERLARLARRLGDIEEVISGSVGIKCALVARGAADLYVHPVPYLKEWDTCAPEAILRGAGGRVTDCSGAGLTYGEPDPHQRGGIFAATAAVWDAARPIVFETTRSLFDDR